MSLSDLLDEVSTRSTTSGLCKFAQILLGPQVDDESRAKIEQILSVPYGIPGRVSNKDLARALRASGIPITDTSIDRHRSGSCPCVNAAMKRADK